jgi:hypothetical protein
MRGTPKDWAALTKAEKDLDTLYFISEPEGEEGKLYLGPKLIAGGGSGASVGSLKDLQDILLSEDIEANSFLVYDSESKKWVNKAASQVLASIATLMKGATADKDGEAGLVPVPAQGQQNLFLRGDATWADPTTELKATVTTLIGEDADKSVRQIARDEVKTVIGTATNAFDTLGEIETWIKNHESAVNLLDLNNKVTNLNNVVINGITGDNGAIKTPSLVKQVSDLNAEFKALNETVNGTEENPASGLVHVTNNLKDTVAILTKTTSTHTKEISEIKESLHWQDLILASE